MRHCVVVLKDRNVFQKAYETSTEWLDLVDATSRRTFEQVCVAHRLWSSEGPGTFAKCVKRDLGHKYVYTFMNEGLMFSVNPSGILYELDVKH